MSKVIAIGAGHYLGTAGRCIPKSLDPKQTKEWVLNDRVADEVERLLAAYDCRVVRVDDTTGKTGISVAARCVAANNAKADVAVSIHHNAGIGGGSGGGIVVFRARNTTGVTKTLQESVYKHLIAETGMRGNRSNPMPQKSYDALVLTKMPAVLCELGFMDSKTDAPMILSKEHPRQAAKGIVDALEEVFKLKKKEEIDMTKAEVTELIEKTVDAAVAKLEAKLTPKVYHTLEECPKWAQPELQECIDAGILRGNDRGDLSLTDSDIRALLWSHREAKASQKGSAV